MNKKKLVLFKGDLDTINLFSEQLKQGFLELGDYEIFEFVLGDMVNSLSGLYNFMQGEPITAMIGFNSTFYGMKLPSGANMFEQLQIPCINIFVDHPYWYASILSQMPSTGIVLCIDRGHMEFVNRFYPQIPVNGFLPHGGTAMETLPKPVSERKTDVFYAGSLYADYITKQKPDFSKWDFPAEKICEETIERLLEEPTGTIEAVLEDTLHKYGVQMAEEELCAFISSCVYIERVVSSRYREAVLSAIAKAGIGLTLYGSGWENCDWIRLPNVHYGGMISPSEVLVQMENAKIVLNTMPWFKDGSHERIFNGMLRGAVVCSDTSGYLEEVLPAEVWESFDLSADSIASLPKRLKALLQDTGRMQRIATAGYELAKDKHTWQERAEELHRDLLSLL
ncbi:MAG: glycosyltransferase [Lachnospiraceae bacterium]|nr:glycosyltransferase [Lachnospiraceae bacterium]